MRLSTFLWLDGRAEEAAEHYTSLVDGAAVLDLARGPDGRVTTATFELAGQRFVAYNGDTPVPFTPAVSLFAECDTQEEIDDLWAGLTDGGQEGPGGSLTDRFGVTWQIVPAHLAELLDRADPQEAEQALAALHTMTRVDIRALTEASNPERMDSP